MNRLLKDKLIDHNTKVHLECARELNTKNRRKALEEYQKTQETKRAKAREELMAYYKECGMSGKNISDTDLLKYKLWEEQSHICLYTGETMGMADVFGENPKYDIEHTIPQSLGGENITENLTLCNRKFNRDVKKAHIPFELFNHKEIMVRIEPWLNKCKNLQDQVDKIHTHVGMEQDQKDKLIVKRHKLELELNYWENKCKPFTLLKAPEGFTLRQKSGIGVISTYALSYLKSVFHNPQNIHQHNVFAINGVATAELRKMWGLQDAYEKKSRDNHAHHCIDAITIACIDQEAYSQMAEYYKTKKTMTHLVAQNHTLKSHGQLLPKMF